MQVALTRGRKIDASAAPNNANSKRAGTNIPIYLAYMYLSNKRIFNNMTHVKHLAPTAMQFALLMHPTPKPKATRDIL
jgi:hypothetical protein